MTAKHPNLTTLTDLLKKMYPSDALRRTMYKRRSALSAFGFMMWPHYVDWVREELLSIWKAIARHDPEVSVSIARITPAPAPGTDPDFDDPEGIVRELAGEGVAYAIEHERPGYTISLSMLARAKEEDVVGFFGNKSRELIGSVEITRYDNERRLDDTTEIVKDPGHAITKTIIAWCWWLDRYREAA